MAESEGTGTATISRAEVAAAFAKAVRVGALDAYSGETGHRIRSKPAGSERSDAGG